MVSVVTDLLELKPNDVVLEIGTGLGYQSAVLAELAGKVYSVEIIDELAQPAVRRLKREGYTNIEVHVGIPLFWLRDATFTLLALMHLGYYDEARAWRDWLIRAVAGSPRQVQIMYGVGGERWLPELVVPWLPGYENRRLCGLETERTSNCRSTSSARLLTRYSKH